jgi:hypothetical protein
VNRHSSGEILPRFVAVAHAPMKSEWAKMKAMAA